MPDLRYLLGLTELLLINSLCYFLISLMMRRIAWQVLFLLLIKIFFLVFEIVTMMLDVDTHLYRYFYSVLSGLLSLLLGLRMGPSFILNVIILRSKLFTW